MPESIRTIVARVETAMVEGVNRPACMAEVAVYDLGVVLNLLKIYGGRADWTPTADNIEKLPGPVRREMKRLRGGR